MAVSRKVRRFMDEGGWIRRVFEEGMALKAQIGAENVFDPVSYTHLRAHET